MALQDRLAEIKARLQPLLNEEARAEELREHVPPGEWYFGLIGVETPEPLTLTPYEEFPCPLRSVTNPPGMIHATRAATPGSDYAAVSRYAPAITAEIVLGVQDSDEVLGDKFAFGLGWHLAALLKLRAAHALLCPVASPISWDTVSAIRERSIRFVMLDDVPRRILAGSPATTTVDRDVASWIAEHLESSYDLRGIDVSRRFGLAFNIAYTWNLTTDVRLAIASVWAGLEALFGDRRDCRVTDALCARISGWLPSATDADVRRLYGRRCDAVHGRAISETVLATELEESAALLRAALIEAIERKAVPLPDWT